MMVCVEAAALPQSDNGAVAHCRLPTTPPPVIVTPMPITAGRRGAISVRPARAPNAKLPQHQPRKHETGRAGVHHEEPPNA